MAASLAVGARRTRTRVSRRWVHCVRCRRRNGCRIEDRLSPPGPLLVFKAALPAIGERGSEPVWAFSWARLGSRNISWGSRRCPTSQSLSNLPVNPQWTPRFPLRMAQPPRPFPPIPAASSPDVALATRMAQPCASTTTQTPCCRFGGVRCNSKKVAAVAVVEIDALIGPRAGGTKGGKGAPGPGGTPAAETGCSCGGSGGGAPAAPPPALPPAPASDAVNNEGPLDASISPVVRPEGAPVGIAMGSQGAHCGPLEPPESVRATVAAATGPVQLPLLAKSASSRKRLASPATDPGIADGGGGPRRAVTAVAKRVALSPKPGIVAVATASDSAGASAAAASSPAPRPKRSRRVVGRDPMPREQRVYFTCTACGYDRNHIRKRTCDRCRAPKIAMPSGSAAEAARSARRAADAELRWGAPGAATAEARDGGGAKGGSRCSLPSLAPAPVGGSEAGGGPEEDRGSGSWPSLVPLLGDPPPAGTNHADHHVHFQTKHE